MRGTALKSVSTKQYNVVLNIASYDSRSLGLELARNSEKREEIISSLKEISNDPKKSVQLVDLLIAKDWRVPRQLMYEGSETHKDEYKSLRNRGETERQENKARDIVRKMLVNFAGEEAVLNNNAPRFKQFLNVKNENAFVEVGRATHQIPEERVVTQKDMLIRKLPTVNEVRKRWEDFGHAAARVQQETQVYNQNITSIRRLDQTNEINSVQKEMLPINTGEIRIKGGVAWDGLGFSDANFASKSADNYIFGILSIILNSPNRSGRITHILNGLDTSRGQAEKYLKLMLSAKLIEVQDNSTYVMTERGECAYVVFTMLRNATIESGYVDAETGELKVDAQKFQIELDKIIQHSSFQKLQAYASEVRKDDCKKPSKENYRPRDIIFENTLGFAVDGVLPTRLNELNRKNDKDNKKIIEYLKRYTALDVVPIAGKTTLLKSTDSGTSLLKILTSIHSLFSF